MIEGRTFQEVLDDVESRAARNLPDRVVAVADLHMNADGEIVHQGDRFRLNGWARKQLGSFLGVSRWNRWFQSASGDERSDEVTRRLSREPGKLKLRLTRDDGERADGVVRALVTDSFNPLDDVRVFRSLHRLLGRQLDVFRFTRVDVTESTTHYTAVHLDVRTVAKDDILPGWYLRNSEVGAAALTIDDFALRVQCLNGLLLQVGGTRLLYRTHRPAEDDVLAATLVVALSKLPDRWDRALTLLAHAREAPVPHPDAAIEAALDDPTIPRALVEDAQRVALREDDRTRFGVVQAITLIAHTTNTDPDVRFVMERAAGNYLGAG